MTAPTVYYSDDAGAPVLTNGQDAFYQVLKACLVDGYGSKAAAGWLVVYDDWAASGHASFTNAGESGVLGLVRATTTDYPPFMYVAEAMIDAQTAVNARSGRIGVADITSFSEGSTQYTQRPHHYNRHYKWCVIANNQFALAWFSNDSSDLFGSPSAVGDVVMLGFGAIKNSRGLGIDNGNFVCVGGSLSSIFNTSYVGNAAFDKVASSAAHSTPFYGPDGDVEVGTKYAYIMPFAAGLLDFPYSAVDGIVINNLMPVVLYSSPYYLRDARELGVITQLLANWSCCRSSNGASYNVFYRLGASFLRDVITIDGASALIAPTCGGLPVVVSLDAGDWL